jgi:hypothetical protein
VNKTIVPVQQTSSAADESLAIFVKASMAASIKEELL